VSKYDTGLIHNKIILSLWWPNA